MQRNERHGAKRTGTASMVACGVLASVIVVVLGPACGGLSSHCSHFCERWKECVDNNVNVDRCEDACEDWADGNSDRETKVDECDECLSQNDECSETNRRCASDCLGVPVR